MLIVSISCLLLLECPFFLSSRRRHTRYWRDWSSDVCSSDLLTVAYLAGLFGVVTAALAFAFARGTMSARARLRGLAVAALVAGAVAGPLVWLSRGSISVYYVG